MMRRRHLPWMLTLGLAAVAALFPGRINGADLDKYLPASTEAVIQINVRQILDAAVIKKYALPQIETDIKKNAEAEKVFGALGLNPLADVKSVTLAGPGGGDKIQTAWTVIVHGNFDPAKIHAVAEHFASDKPEQLKITKENDVPVYEFHNPNPQPGQPATLYAAVLGKSHLVVSGSKDIIVDDVAISAGKKEPAANKQLAALVKHLDGSQSLWLAGLISQQVKDLMAHNPQLKDIAGSLESISGGVTLTEGISATFHINTDSPKAAAKIHQLLDGVRALAQLALANNEQIKDFAPLITDALSGLKFSDEKNAAVIEVTISENLIEKAAKLKEGQK